MLQALITYVTYVHSDVVELFQLVEPMAKCLLRGEQLPADLSMDDLSKQCDQCLQQQTLQNREPEMSWEPTKMESPLADPLDPRSRFDIICF